MIQAGFDSVCSCGARIREGDSIGLVDGEWCCEDCMTDMGEDAERVPCPLCAGDGCCDCADGMVRGPDAPA